MMADSVVTLKEEGNELFKEGNFPEAYKKYTEALKLDSSNSVLYSNRSATSIKLKNFELALSDAQKCTKHSPGWAKGFMREAVALEGLGRHSEVMQSAANGFKVCGEGWIKRELVSLWLRANQAQNCLPEGSIELPRGILIMSEDYLYVLACLMRSLSGEQPLGLSLAVQCLHSCAEQIETMLLSFGEPVSPVIKDWAKDLPNEVYPYNIDPVGKAKLEQGMKSRGEAFVQFLNNDIDPALYPLLRPILGLVVLVVLNRTNILTECNTGHHSAELMNRALLPLFETSILSTEDYYSLYIGRICGVLDSFIGRGYRLCTEELGTVENICKKLEKAIQNYPKSLPECHKDKQLAERALSNVRNNVLMPVSSSAPKIPPSSSMSVEMAEQIVKEKPEEVKAYITKHLRELESAEFLTMGEVEELLTMTGIYLELGEEANALKVFTKGEQAFFQVLGHMLNANTLKLDQCPATIGTIRQSVLNKALQLKRPALFADVALRWKCLFKEFRTDLIRSSPRDLFGAFFKWHTDRITSSKDPAAEDVQETLRKQMLEEEQLLQTSAKSVLASIAETTYAVLQKRLPSGTATIDYIFFTPLGSDELMEAYCVLCERDIAPIVCKLNYKAIHNQSAVVTTLMYQTSEVDESQIVKFKGRIESDLAILAKFAFPDCIVEHLASRNINHLYISPASDFVGVPMDLLPISLNSSPPMPLYEQFSVSLLPSMRELLLYDNTTEKHALGQVCSIIGNPNFNLQKSSTELSAIDKLASYFCGYFNISTPNGPILEQLVHSQDEVDFISLQLKSHGLPVQTLVGDEAVLSNVLSLDNPVILHISSHAYTECGDRTGLAFRGNFFDDLQTCAIALAGFNTFSRNQYDWIRPDCGPAQLPQLAIFSMKLRTTKLVFLSTCNSAIGIATSQEAINSLADAFLVAGVETVIATLWPVGDQLATEFSKFFYEKLVNTANIRPSEALTYAKRCFKKLGLWPCFGAFICYGLDKPLNLLCT